MKSMRFDWNIVVLLFNHVDEKWKIHIIWNSIKIVHTTLYSFYYLFYVKYFLKSVCILNLHSTKLVLFSVITKRCTIIELNWNKNKRINKNKRLSMDGLWFYTYQFIFNFWIKFKTMTIFTKPLKIFTLIDKTKSNVIEL